MQMKKLNSTLFLLISLFLVIYGCTFEKKDIRSSKANYKEWIKENFNVTGYKIFLLPQKGCNPCLKQDASFLIEKIRDVRTNSPIIIITSDSTIYNSLKSQEIPTAKIIYDNKKILDSNFETDISNMTFLDFSNNNFKPIFTYHGFDYHTISI